MRYVLVAFLIVTAGCALFQPVTPMPDSTTPGGQLQKAASGINFLTPLAVLGIAAGVVTAFRGAMKMGLSIVAGSVTVLVVNLVIARYATLIALLGVIAGIAVTVIGFIRKYQGLALALAEVVQGVQKVKDVLKPDRETINGTLESNQSPATQKLVGKIKSGLSSQESA